MKQKTTVAAVQPAMGPNGPKSYQNKQDGTPRYVFMYQLANGMAGEAVHKTPTPRFNVGEEVEASVEQGQYGPKLSIDKPGGFSGKGGGGKSWSPEKEQSVMLQGMIHAAAADGTTDVNAIEARTRAQMTVHAKLMAEWKSQQPAPAPAPAPAPQGYAPPMPAQQQPPQNGYPQQGGYQHPYAQPQQQQWQPRVPGGASAFPDDGNHPF